jgi:hypothetical protein
MNADAGRPLKGTDGEVSMKSPTSMLAYEAFKIRNGILDEVWAIGGALKPASATLIRMSFQ